MNVNLDEEDDEKMNIHKDDILLVYACCVEHKFNLIAICFSVQPI